MVERKRWKDVIEPGLAHHLAVVVSLPGRPARLHTHDFPEIFWLERGRGEHTINGQVKGVDAGDLVFIRPEDQHVLRAVDAAGFKLINVAFVPSVRTDLLRRHPDAFAPLLDPASSLPCRVRLTAASLATLRDQLPQLSSAGRGRLALEHFLLGLPLLLRPPEVSSLPTMPEWLRHACEEIQRPALFALGAPGLVRASGRSAAHVARSVRAALGCTPSDVVNGVRMAHAARELRITDRPITDIAYECGLSNLSHFYSLFRRAHGQTPRAFRLGRQRAVV